jgi:hypothetical protein
MGCIQNSVDGYLDIAKERGGISKDYLLILNKWTRDKIVYSEFETNCRIAATLKSREFNEAYAREYARIYLLTKPEEKINMETVNELSSDFTEFFVYAYIPEKESNDFATANSMWTVFLVDAKGQKHYPLELRKIEKITPVIEGFYPYGNQYYGHYYSLKFPLLAPAGNNSPYMKLVFTSVIGQIEMEWKN